LAGVLFAFSNTLKYKIYVIMDALDECKNAISLLHGLLDAQSQSSAQINPSFTSPQMHIPFSCNEDMVLESPSANPPIRKNIEHQILRTKNVFDEALSMVVDR